MVILRILQALCGLSTLIYLTGWLLALIGLSLIQNDCSDVVEPFNELQDLPFTSVALGKKCRTFFRFSWFVWALSTVPVLLALVNMVKPKLVARGTGPLFAVCCVLQIIMANLYLDISRRATPSLELSKGDVDEYAKVALAGFAIMATGALLQMIFESVMDPNREKKDKNHDHDHHGDHDHSRDYNKGEHHESRARRSNDGVGRRAVGGRADPEPAMRPVVVPPVGGVEHGRPVPIAGEQRPVLVGANRV